MSQNAHPNAPDLLREGIAAAKAKERDRARALLMQVVELDEENAAAWMWLSGVVDDLDDKQVCLENVLALEPGNEAARRGLAWVRDQKAKQLPDQVEDQGLIPESPPLYVKPEPATAIQSAAMQLAAKPQPVFEPRYLVESPQAGPDKEPWEEPWDPFLCPYCTAPTEEADRKCPACGNDLWLKFRRREDQSWWLVNVMVFQFVMILAYAIAPLMVLTYVAFKVIGNFDPFPLLPAYLGFEGNLPPEIAQAALDMVPRLYLLPFAGLALYSLGMLIGTWFRCKPVFYLLFWGAAVKIALSVAAIAFGRFQSIICGGAGLLFSLVTIFIIFQLEDDLLGREERLYFAISRRIKGATTQIAQGKSFAKQQMWALSILYLRSGLAQMPEQTAGRSTLIFAYMQIGRYDLARQALREAQRLAPDNPRFKELALLLDGQPPQTTPEAGN
ncbi:MAG: hypothetical protein JW934_07685 [Anaerolineae bacterium]|nr:hypothetical protein [Anaerolineae bacterium]